MSFAQNYFQRYKSQPKIFSDNPCSNTGIIVVIPCYNDPFIFKTLDSLESAKNIDSNVEVIVIVNSGEKTDESIVEENRKTFDKLSEYAAKNYFTKFRLLPTIIEQTPKKIAGVGFARKTGMDEAVRRFDHIENHSGIICSLDADTLVSEDYFTQIYKFYEQNKKAGACIFQFQHNFNKTIFTNEEIEACKLYEIYLRYFRLALEYTGFPYPIHTIGFVLV
jgi:cellulose synthase/poly-beta-1,6-N-acetylglucosamine synthase-like glycosyltransferase